MVVIEGPYLRMNSSPSSSLELNEVGKLNNMPLGLELDLHGAISFPVPDDFDLQPLSQADVAFLPPIMTLPNQVVAGEGAHYQGNGGTDFPMATTAHPSVAKERIRDNNRRAQIDYRRREKAKRKELDDAVNIAKQDMRRLTVENAHLGFNVDLMEKVLAYRDNAVLVLEMNTTEVEIKKGAPPYAHPSRKYVLTPGLVTKNSSVETEVDASSGRNDAAIKESDNGETCPLTRFSRSEALKFRQVGKVMLQSRYRKMAMTLTHALSDLNDPEAAPYTKSAAEGAMMEALGDCGCMCFESALLNPTGLQNLLAVSVGEDCVDENNCAAKWAEITRSLVLTPEQRESMQRPKQVFAQQSKRIGRKRKEILGALRGQAHVPVQPSEEGDMCIKVLNAETSDWLSLHEATTELEEDLQEEHIACMEFLVQIFGIILSPLQRAKAIVASYPLFPDAFAIAVAAGEERYLLDNALEAAAFSGQARGLGC